MSRRLSFDAINLFEPGTPVAALPSWGSARLLLPARSARVRWEASGFYPAHLWRARAFRMALRTAAFCGLPPTRRAPDSSEPLLDRLRHAWPEAERMAVQLGAPGLAQTWTAEVRAASGHILGYAKGAWEPAAVRRLEAEAAVLPSVPAGLGPEVVWAGPWAGGFVLATTVVHGEPLYPGLPCPPELARFADSLIVGEPRSLDSHPWVKGLPQHDVLEPALDTLSRRDWPVVVQHGDCAPWNLRRSSTGITAFDWEFGEPEALPHLDEAYFVLQQAYKPLKWSPREAAEAATLQLQQRDLSAAEAGAIVRLAAFDAWRKALPLVSTADLQTWRQQIWAG